MAKHKKSLQILILSLMLANLFLAFDAKPVLAQTSTATSTQKYRGVDEQIKAFLCTPSDAQTDPQAAKGDLYNCINKLYRFALIIVSVFGVLMIILGGWVYMSAAGNEEAVTKAKDILTTTIVAMIILFSGYVLLNFLNPDLIKFQPIQPPSVVGRDKAYSFQKALVEVLEKSDGSYTVTGGAGHAAQELQDMGCVFQTDKQKQEVANLTEGTFGKIKDLCYNTRNGLKSRYPNVYPKISSVIGYGKHADGSYHYKGCAIDFADGRNNFTTTEPGITIISEAKKLGLRVNPGTDASQTFQVHVDTYTACETK